MAVPHRRRTTGPRCHRRRASRGGRRSRQPALRRRPVSRDPASRSAWPRANGQRCTRRRRRRCRPPPCSRRVVPPGWRSTTPEPASPEPPAWRGVRVRRSGRARVRGPAPRPASGTACCSSSS
ncbi:MAG: hypothetical protein DWI03_03540 [Planctomycetota bacterium]|nr:MAG: hypothetical protein DWI03_03540 [Planctomycetota bacterium]